MPDSDLNETYSLPRELSKEELHHLASFPELNPNPVLEVTQKGEICYTNLSAKKIIEEIPGAKEELLRKALEIFSNEKVTIADSDFGKIKIEDKYYEQHFNCVENGKKLRVYHRDVTEREQIIRELQEQRKFFRKVIDLNPSFIFAKNRAGEFTLVNQAVADAYGTTVEGLIGKTDADFNDNAEEVEHFRQDDLEVMDSQKQKFVPEEIITDASGKIRYLQTVKIPIKNTDGVVDQILGVATDISERKKAEEERIKLESQVQHSQKLESLGILAGGIAHDFNNLLMGIVGNADLLLLDLEENSPYRKKVRHIKAASKRLADLTNQLLAYSGRGAFIIEDIDLSSVAREMTQLLKTVISKKAVLNLLLESDLPLVKADATQIRQIVMNLITNASDSLDSGNGEISLRSGTEIINEAGIKNSFIKEEVPAGEYVFLEVQDTGVGIAKDTMSKIFDPFFTTKFIGQGLGLSAVLGIVRSHKGTLSVKSEVGVGTKIKILFPVSKEKDSIKNKTINQSEPNNELLTGKILIVDDEITMRRVTKSMLDKFEYKSSVATNGNEAIDILKNNLSDYSAVILDLSMPEKNGKETLREIRELSKDLPVILTSGYTELDATKDFKKDSFSGFLQKPFGPKELLEVLLPTLKREISS